MTDYPPHHNHSLRTAMDARTDAPAHEHTAHQNNAMRGNVTAMALGATLHCLTGCAIGEIAGLMIGTAAGLSNALTIALSIALAFFFGYTLSTLPLLKSGLGVRTALTVVLAADTLSILTMEIVDNAVVAAIPGAMNAGLVNVVFWVGLMIALVVVFVAAFPVNRYLLQRGKGHALTHEYHHDAQATPSGWRRFIPALRSGALAAALIAFMLGGLTVSIAAQAETAGTNSSQSVADHG